MSTALDTPHLLLGAYILGGLSEADRRTFTGHLHSCPPCRDEVASMAWLRRCLARLGPDARLRVVAELVRPAASSSSDLDAPDGTSEHGRR